MVRHSNTPSFVVLVPGDVGKINETYSPIIAVDVKAGRLEQIVH